MQNVISRSGGHAEKAWFSETIKMRGSSHKHDHDITTHVPVYYIVAVIGGNVPLHSVEKKNTCKDGEIASCHWQPVPILNPELLSVLL